MAAVRSGLRLVPIGFLLMGALGCGNPCDNESESVHKSLEQARSVHADLYAPQEFERARSAAGAYEQECGRQRNRFVLFRSYRRAQEAANEAKRLSDAATERGKAGEGLMRQEVLNARYEAGMAVNEAVIALRRERGLHGDPRSDALLARLDGLRAELVEMQRMLDRGGLPEAREKAVRIREQAIQLLAEANGGAAPAR
ncbi:MAG TPA: hypothetical protein VFW45_13625 [Candidatus Polarisedimenticolia bacterium]|nr:hypothetical protein [Candidatus Polarisedimenticolia bacterium]